jgi:hypothetical protein
MPAWNHGRIWDSATIEEYGVRCASWYAGPALGRLDCADLAIQLIVEFASSRGLPVVVAGLAPLLDSRIHSGSRSSFLTAAQRSVRAADLQLPTNTRLIGRGAHAVRPGRLLLHLFGGRGTHVQVATRISNDNRWVSIVQGNLEEGIGLRTILTGRTVPQGTRPQTGHYNPDRSGFGGTYERDGRPAVTSDMWAAVEVREWNFMGWNHR